MRGQRNTRRATRALFSRIERTSFVRTVVKMDGHGSMTSTLPARSDNPSVQHDPHVTEGGQASKSLARISVKHDCDAGLKASLTDTGNPELRTQRRAWALISRGGFPKAQAPHEPVVASGPMSA
jgi:hypothetical protein